MAEDVELAESVSIAMLTVLETLGPTERAVFVLREVFDVPYDEIAEAVGKTPAAVRQIAHRARAHVAAAAGGCGDRAEQQSSVDHFIAALRTGDMQRLMDMLAPDVVLVADGGGVATAIRRPIEGLERVARLLAGFQRLGSDIAIARVAQRGAGHPHRRGRPRPRRSAWESRAAGSRGST